MTGSTSTSRSILDAQTDAWGIKVANVEIKHIDLDENMVRAIARQAEAERLRRAKVIDAEGELQAAEKLVQAAEIIARRPESMQLRYLGTLANIAGEKSSTIIFPLPIDLLSVLRGKGPAIAGGGSGLIEVEGRCRRGLYPGSTKLGRLHAFDSRHRR